MCLKFSQKPDYRIKVQGMALRAVLFVGVLLSDGYKDKNAIALLIRIKGTQSMN